MKHTADIPKRKKKWLCSKIDFRMNQIYTDIMEINECYFQDDNEREQYVEHIVSRCIKRLLCLEMPLLSLWNVQRYEMKTMVEWYSRIDNEISLLNSMSNGEDVTNTMSVLDWRKINETRFLKNMSELHRYTHGKVINAKSAYDDTQGNLLIDLVNEAFYHLILANRKIPVTKAEYIKRKEHISHSISTLRKMNRSLLFYFNLMQYSERVMNEWSAMLVQELKMLSGLQKSDKARFGNLE